MGPTVAGFVADKWGHVCPSIRIESPLKEAGIRLLRGNEWVKGKLSVNYDLVNDVDFLIIQRDFPFYEEEYQKIVNEARAQKKPLIYEIDDLLLEMPEFHPDIKRYKPIKPLILKAIFDADAITCSNNELRDYIQRLNPNVFVLPNFLDPNIWRFVEHQKNKSNNSPINIAFMGTKSHKPDIDEVAPALIKISQKYGSLVRFAFWGCEPPEVLRYSRYVDYVDVALENYASFAEWFMSQKVDIFIAPLKDCVFNRAKSPLKYLEYSILGVPGIYSNLPPYAQVVENGVNGFLASNLEEWQQILTLLIENPSLRDKIGSSAQSFVKNHFILTEEKAAQWRSVFEQITYSPKSQLYFLACDGVVDITRKWLSEENRDLELIYSKVSELRNLLDYKEITIKNLQDQIYAITNSFSWKFLTRISIFRHRFMPKGSALDKFLSLSKHLVLLLATRKNKIRNKDQKKYDCKNLEIIPFPKEGESLVTIVIHRKNNQILSFVEHLTHWIKTQTVPAHFVVWDEFNQTLEWRLPFSDVLSGIKNWHDVQSSLKTKYIVLGYFDLISMPSTFLETNLHALEIEKLNFTLNQFGYTELFQEKVTAGFLPGDCDMPGFRFVFRKELVGFFLGGANKNMDVIRKDKIVGKVLIQPVNKPDSVANVPFELRMTDLSLNFQDGYFSYDQNKSDEALAKDFDKKTNKVIFPFEVPKKNKPAVLMVHPFLAVGGAENIALSVIELLKNDFSFVISTQEKHKIELGTTVDEFRNNTPFIYTFADFLNKETYLPFMNYLINRFEVDTLYIANGNIWVYDNLEKIRNRYPKLRIVNQVYDHEAGWINRYNRSFAELIDAHISSNNKITKAYNQRGVPLSKIYYIENGVNTQVFNPSMYTEQKVAELKIRLGLPLDTKIITFIGRIHPQKRPLDFLEIARRATVSGKNYFFLMVGDGILSEKIDGEIISKGLTRVHHRPFYTPSRDIFAVSDIVVLTSEYEGMPMVVLEAQAMGVPIVSTDVGNIKEVLLETGGGIADAKPGEIDKLLLDIEKVLTNPVDKSKVRQVIIQKYSLELMAEKYKKAFLGEK